MTAPEAGTRPTAGGRGRAAVAHVVWWTCVGAGLLLAGALLLTTLRADADAQPWSSWFVVADALTPGLLHGGWTRDAVWWRESIRDDAVGYALAAAVWTVVGLVGAVVLRPRPVGRAGGRPAGGARRSIASTTTWSRAEVAATPSEDGDGATPTP